MKPSSTYLSFFLFLLSFSFCACSQGDSSQKPTPAVKHYVHRLGSTPVTIKETSYPVEVPIQLVQLHSNEETADEVTDSISKKMGISYIQILNNNRRFIEFELGNNKYKFDPNRIFSKTGIAATLRSRSRYGEKAYRAIQTFSEFFLGLLDLRKTIIAVHNNSEGAFTLAAYTKDKTGLVYKNPDHDPDDFFITTDRTLFQRIKEKNFNVVLEYTDAVKQDGSLSIYCGRNNISYVNVEAQHGHSTEQARMLEVLVEILTRENK